MYLRRPHPSQLLFIGLGIVVELAANEALAVADEPHLALQATEHDGTGRQTVFGMTGELGQLGMAVVGADVSGYPSAELLASNSGRHTPDVLPDKPCGIAAVGAEQAVTAVGLAGASIDDGDEVIGDDDEILAFLRGILWDDELFEYLHW